MYQETCTNIYNMNRQDIRNYLGYSQDYPLEKIVNDIIPYFRKSRKDEELYGNEAVEETLARHIKTIQEWAINIFGVPFPEENIKKEVVSGESINGRPVVQEVLKMIESPRYRAIVCIDVQRLSRGDMEDQGRLIKILKYSNTKVLTPSQWFDLDNKFDNKFFRQKMRESEEYLEYAKEKMGDGRLRSVLDGTWPHSTAPYGFYRVKLQNRKGFTLAHKKDEYEVCKLAVRLLKEGLHIQYEIQENDSWQSIAKTFGMQIDKIMASNTNVEFKPSSYITISEKEVGTSIIANYFNFLEIQPRNSDTWTPAMIRNILKSLPAHGFVSWGRRKTSKVLECGEISKTRPINKDAIIIKGIWEPIYNCEEIEIINRYSLKRHKPILKTKEVKNPLVGLVKCEICNSNMQRRPYSEKKLKSMKRVHKINKEQLSLYLRSKKEESKLSINDIARMSHISKDIISHIFTSNLNNFTVPKANYWEPIKKALELKETTFDEEILTLEDNIKVHTDTLICNHKGCTNVGSDLNLVEQKVIESLKIILNDYKDYINNYELKIKEEIKTTELTTQIIENKIVTAKQKLDKICDLLEDGTYTQQLFYERKAKIDKEIAELELRKKQLSNETSIKKFNERKKMIPNIESVLKNYAWELSSEEKNKLLSSIIEKIYYRKDKRGTKTNGKDAFSLKIYLKN